LPMWAVDQESTAGYPIIAKILAKITLSKKFLETELQPKTFRI
jgi:hypothetical protein